MSAAAAVMILAVVLIVLALVYFLVATIFELRKIVAGLDRVIEHVGGIVEKSAPVNEIVNDINANLDAGVSALEGLLVKKAGMSDAVGLVDGLYPGAAAAGLRDFPESSEVVPPRIGEVYTKGTLTLARLGREAPIAAASPRGAVLRNVEYGSSAARALYPAGRDTGGRGAAALAGHRHRLAGAVRAARGHRPASQALPGQAVLTEERSRVQTPAPFEYERATSVEGAIASLERLGAEARIIAGGHSLLPMMKLRLAQPEHLIDINDLDELAYIREEGGVIRIGALTRHVDLLKSELLAKHFPLFRDAEEVIADPVVRNRGTIGGSLCQADAAEDLSAVCSAAKAHVLIRGSGGEREVDMADFHVGPYTTAVGAGELLTEVRLPIFPGAGSAHEKVERRAGDWAIAAASAAVWIEAGKFSQVGIALSAVGLTTIHLTRAEDLLRGQPPSEELFAQAREIAAEDCSPSADGRGPIDYKRHLAGVLTQRALRRATERALS